MPPCRSTTVALIACPDGNDELTAIVCQSNTVGRARWNTSLSTPLRRMLPADGGEEEARRVLVLRVPEEERRDADDHEHDGAGAEVA